MMSVIENKNKILILQDPTTILAPPPPPPQTVELYNVQTETKGGRNTEDKCR